MWGVEFKWSSAPRMTPSMRNALVDLGLEGILVVHPGDKEWPIADRVESVSLAGAVRRLGVGARRG